MQKRLINMGKRFGKATLALLFLSVLTLAVMITPVARAQGGETMTLSPSKGPPGTLVQLTITGFPEYTPVNFMFGVTNLGQVTPTSVQYSTVFNVPGVSDGTFTVTATSALGGFDFASATFIVGSAATPAPPTVSPSATPSGTYSPSGTPIQHFQTSPPVTVSSGFWSPLTIALTAVVVAFVIFVTAVYLRRGKQKPLSYEEDSRYEPRPSTPSNTPYAPSSTNQPATSTSYQPYSSSRTATRTSYQPYSSSRINQPSTYGSYQTYSSSRYNQQGAGRPQAAYTRTCPHCKRAVRDDVNICPYCSTRLR